MNKLLSVDGVLEGSEVYTPNIQVEHSSHTVWRMLAFADNSLHLQNTNGSVMCQVHTINECDRKIILENGHGLILVSP
jgi:hypothetical protein